MSTTKPTIVIIPGSFSPGSFYFATVDKLREYGYEAMVKDLPSASRLPPEKAATMYEDADYFRAIAEKLADEGKDVVFVTHSYGGVVGTEAAKGVLKTDRQAAGKPGGIVRLVYVTSVVPSQGGSLRSLLGDLVPSFIEIEVSPEPQLPKSRPHLFDMPGRVHAPCRCRRQRETHILRTPSRTRHRTGQEDVAPFGSELRRRIDLSRVQTRPGLVCLL